MKVKIPLPAQRVPHKRGLRLVRSLRSLRPAAAVLEVVLFLFVCIFDSVPGLQNNHLLIAFVMVHVHSRLSFARFRFCRIPNFLCACRCVCVCVYGGTVYSGLEPMTGMLLSRSS